MENSFVAVDFETANESRSSICQAAVAIVKNGVVVDSKEWLIKPKDLLFSGFNTFIHGITADDVKHSPEFPEVWKELKDILHTNVVVAHNAAFDMYALRDVLCLYDIELPNFNFWCTLSESKKRFSLDKYRLPNVCKHMQIEFSNHHHARYDAIACASIAAKFGLVSNFRQFPSHLEPQKNLLLPSRIKRANLEGIEIYDLSEVVTPSTFFGKNIVVTGVFNEICRAEAEEYVLRMGAKLTTSINSKTSLLVLGMNAGPSKVEKIKELNKKMFIPVIDEKEFLEVLEALTLRNPDKN